jgi:hypothetical protein
MYEKNNFVLHSKSTEDFGTDPHPHPDSLVRGTDPRIRNTVELGSYPPKPVLGKFSRLILVLWMRGIFKKFEI